MGYGCANFRISIIFWFLRLRVENDLLILAFLAYFGIFLANFATIKTFLEI